MTLATSFDYKSQKSLAAKNLSCPYLCPVAHVVTLAHIACSFVKRSGSRCSFVAAYCGDWPAMQQDIGTFLEGAACGCVNQCPKRTCTGPGVSQRACNDAAEVICPESEGVAHWTRLYRPEKSIRSRAPLKGLGNLQASQLDRH